MSRDPKAEISNSSDFHHLGEFSPPAGTQDPDECFKTLLKRSRDLLYPAGFRKHGQSFTRPYGITTQVINWQRSQWRITKNHPIDFTINIGFWIHSLSPEADVKLPRINHLVFVQRIGRMGPPPHSDTWWTVGNASHIDPILEDMGNRLLKYVVPYCDQCDTPEHIDQALQLQNERYAGFSFSEWLDTQVKQ